MPNKTSTAVFDFTIFITGLVVWKPLDKSSGTFIGVRTASMHNPHHAADPSHLSHVATLTYETSALSGLDGKRVPAPDPLIAAPNAALFARRVLVDEILWLEPTFAGEPQSLSDDVPDLLRLKELDSRVDGIRSDCFGTVLEGTPAISRLDVGAGKLSVHKSVGYGPWWVKGPKGAASETEITSVANILRFDLTKLRSLTIHSNKNPALHFTGEGQLVSSYTVEPAVDFVPPIYEHFPHFEMAFQVAAWVGDAAPQQFCTVRPVNEAPLTVGDRACPPAGG